MRLYSNGFRVDRLNKNKDTLTRFYNKSGWLSQYALGCGYIEQIRFNKQISDFQDIVLTLEKDGNYHVKAYNHTLGHRIAWNSYDTYTEAKDNFITLRRCIGNKLIS